MDSSILFPIKKLNENYATTVIYNLKVEHGFWNREHFQIRLVINQKNGTAM
jgi:hypothetical protein